MTHKGSTDGALLTVFLGRLIRTSARKILLIFDRLKAHEKATVLDWVEAHKDRIGLFAMPPHVPDYNTDEYLNNDLKGNVYEAGLPDDLSCAIRFSRSHRLLPSRTNL